MKKKYDFLMYVTEENKDDVIKICDILKKCGFTYTFFGENNNAKNFMVVSPVNLDDKNMHLLLKEYVKESYFVGIDEVNHTAINYFNHVFNDVNELIKYLKKKKTYNIVKVISLLLILIIALILFILSAFASKNNKAEENNIKKENVAITTTSKKSSEDHSMFIDPDGVICVNGECELSVGEDRYKALSEEASFLYTVSNYEEVKIKIYYEEQNNKKTITKYELYDVKSEEKVNDVKNEIDIRKRYGYFLEGEYEEKFLLFNFSTYPGFVMKDIDVTGKVFYTYDFVFEDKNSRKLKMTLNVDEPIQNIDKVYTKNKIYKIRFLVDNEYNYQLLQIINS